MTEPTAAMPYSNGGDGAHIVDDGVFRLLLSMEIRQAQRLRYSISVVFINVERGLFPDGTPSSSAAKIIAPIIRGTDAIMPRDAWTIALLLVGAEAESLATIVRRVTAELETVPWSAGGACYPQTAASADDLLEQAVEMMSKAKQDGGRRFYAARTSSP